SDSTSATRALAPELVRCLPVPIGSVSAVLRIVLPIALPLAVDVAVEIIVTIEIIIVVDVDISAVPIAIAPGAAPSPPSSGTERNSSAPRQSCPWNVARIGIRVIRVCRRRRPINDRRIVRGDVNYVGLGWLDCDHLFAAWNCLGLHYLLGAGF